MPLKTTYIAAMSHRTRGEQAMITDEEIPRRLRHVKQVTTPVERVVNELVDVKSHSVVLRSERTGEAREIPFQAFRNAATTTPHGVIVRT
jgi:hypothetical protein